ncbi:MAG: alpha/beta fold hydrolase [Chitinophagaceae bacterium]|nr:alpha/beta fold hydrolase [Chitinophagaceae bacterium]
MQTILLLHGAIGAANQLSGVENELADSVAVLHFNFSGHGGSPFAAEDFSIALFAMEVMAFLDKKGIPSINIFGYSMGGYVAMYLAKHHPERVNKIITLATKFKWDENIAANETKMLNAEKIEAKLPDFAASLQKRHAPNNWKTVLEKTAAMLVEMGKDNPLKPVDYPAIQQPVLLMLGDRDKMVTLEETVEVYKNLPKAQLAILPNTAHPIEMVDQARLAYEIRSFLA